MDFDARSYTSGKTFRPKPQVFTREESGLTAVITPWGPAELGEQLWNKIHETFDNPESEKSTQYSLPLETAVANRLAQTLRLVHQEFYQTENMKQLRLGVEVVLFHRSGNRLAWARVGQPHIVLKIGDDLHPLAYEADWSFHHQATAPLLTNALGIEANVAVQTGTLELTRKGTLILVSRGSLPRGFFAVEKPTLQSLSRSLVDADANAPFWIGMNEL